MGTLSSELGSHLDRSSRRARVYADANVPARLVTFMRHRLRWDVLFVLEHPELRRAHDREHYRLARQLRRTLLTLDRDYIDDRRFPAEESGGVILVSAPDERALAKLLVQIDRMIFRAARQTSGERSQAAPPLLGRKLHTHVGWPEEP